MFRKATSSFHKTLYPLESLSRSPHYSYIPLTSSTGEDKGQASSEQDGGWGTKFKEALTLRFVPVLTLHLCKPESEILLKFGT